MYNFVFFFYSVVVVWQSNDHKFLLNGWFLFPFSYEPELFPGLIYRMVKPRIVLLIFVSGKVVLTGKVELVFQLYRKNHRSCLAALTLTWFLWDIKEPTPLFEKCRGCRPRRCGQPSHVTSFTSWVEWVQLAHEWTRAAASGSFVLQRPSLLFTLLI